MLLSELPLEIIYHITEYLSTASALANLARTCRRLHAIVTAADSRVYRAFVQKRFPAIPTPPFWRDAAQALTSRARALDRHAVICRFALPPENAKKIGSHRATRRDNPTLGFRPALDCYEVWTGGRWCDRREVLAWGAADELVIRVRTSGEHAEEKWFVLNDLDTAVTSWDDICGLRLLGPEQHGGDPRTEHLIFGRMLGDLHRLVIWRDDGDDNAATGHHAYTQKFLTGGLELARMDVSGGPDAVVAAHFNNSLIAFYRTDTHEAEVEPFVRWQLSPAGKPSQQCSRFLSDRTIAVGTGGLANSLSICALSPTGVSTLRQIGVGQLDLEDRFGMDLLAAVNSIAPLSSQDAVGSRPSGDVFLAGWGDRAVRFVSSWCFQQYYALQGKRDYFNADAGSFIFFLFFYLFVSPFAHSPQAA